MCICICEANATLQNQNTVCLLFYQQLIIEAYDPFCVGVMVHPAVCTIKSLSTGIAFNASNCFSLVSTLSLPVSSAD